MNTSLSLNNGLLDCTYLPHAVRELNNKRRRAPSSTPLWQKKWVRPFQQDNVGLLNLLQDVKCLQKKIVGSLTPIPPACPCLVTVPPPRLLLEFLHQAGVLRQKRIKAPESNTDCFSEGDCVYWRFGSLPALSKSSQRPDARARTS